MFTCKVWSRQKGKIVIDYVLYGSLLKEYIQDKLFNYIKNKSIYYNIIYNKMIK